MINPYAMRVGGVRIEFRKEFVIMHHRTRSKHSELNVLSQKLFPFQVTYTVELKSIRVVKGM